MSCHKRPKEKFLFWMVRMPHKYELGRVWDWGSYSWHMWQWSSKCKYCGITKRHAPTEEDSLPKEVYNKLVEQGDITHD